MKVVKFIKNIIIGIVAILFFAFVIFNTLLLLNIDKKFGVTTFDDKTLIIVRDQISSENYKKGDAVIVQSKALEKIKVGDELFVYKVQKTGRPVVDIGIVGEVYNNENAISFKNGATYDMQFVAGSSIKTYPEIGTYLAVIQSTWGFLFIILIPSFLVFIYELYAIVVEIRLGKENN